MADDDVKSHARKRRLHPWPVRIMHWVNALAVIIMITSGWKIYNDEVIFGWLHFPDAITLGVWAQHGLQWHFLGMWIFVLNGLFYVAYGLFSGRFRQKLFPISIGELFVTIGDALRFRLKHDDLTHYNAVQKVLYLGILLVGALIVIPVVAAMLIARSFKQTLLFASALGFISVILGLFAAYYLNIPAGGAIVLCALTILGLAFLLTTTTRR